MSRDHLPKVPASEPPAFPVLVGQLVVWVACGPFGLLEEAFPRPDLAKAATAFEFRRLWRLQKEEDDEAICQMRNEVLGRMLEVEGGGDHDATWVKFPKTISHGFDEQRFIALRRPSQIVGASGYLSEEDCAYSLKQDGYVI